MAFFVRFWLGHVAALVGLQLAAFSLGLWAFGDTRSVTLYGLLLFASTAPPVVAAPVTGLLLDRWNRKRLLLLGRLGAAGCCLLLALLTALELGPTWSIAVILAVAAALQAVELPALAATAPLMVEPAQLERANGLVPLGMAIAIMLAPTAASWLLPEIGVSAVLILASAAIGASALMLLTVRIPEVPQGETKTAGKQLWHEASRGWRFITQSNGLLGLLLLLVLVQLELGMLEILVTPLTLAVGDMTALGWVFAAGGIGMLLGSLFVVFRNGRRRRMPLILGVILAQGCLLFLGAARPSTFLIACSAFGLLALFPTLAAANDTIWQNVVPGKLQGRVFGLRNGVTGAALPLAQLITGPLTDRAERSLGEGGALTGTVGLVLGIGPGRGAALMFCALGALLLLGAALASTSRAVRRVEDVDESQALSTAALNTNNAEVSP